MSCVASFSGIAWRPKVQQTSDLGARLICPIKFNEPWAMPGPKASRLVSPSASQRQWQGQEGWMFLRDPSLFRKNLQTVPHGLAFLLVSGPRTQEMQSNVGDCKQCRCSPANRHANTFCRPRAMEVIVRESMRSWIYATNAVGLKHGS